MPDARQVSSSYAIVEYDPSWPAAFEAEQATRANGWRALGTSGVATPFRVPSTYARLDPCGSTPT